MVSKLRESLSFGFEQTFTTPDWWTDPGFVATSDTPLKREKMLLLSQKLAEVMKGRFIESADMYGHLQYETFDATGANSFVVTMDPGSIEVKTPPLFIVGMEEAMHPLFEAAALSGLVPYRNWWYGVKTGTEGGCHVNMAGLTPESNPLRNDARLVMQYAAFFHNNPWIHYPFMGVDVGPGGNCMRMDEHALDPHSDHSPGTTDSIARFAELSRRINLGERPSAEEIEAHFRGTKLAEDKHSAPSFYKFKAPSFFIEDRAVEALRSAEDFFLVSDLRLRILESLEKSGQVEELRDFGPALHREILSSTVLWNGFVEMCTRLKIKPEPYRRFFDRQFPRLSQGHAVPSILEVREGRRQRVIADIQMRGKLIISKTVDTTYARLELLWQGAYRCFINGHLVEPAVLESDGRLIRTVVFDYRKTVGWKVDVALVDDQGKVVEKARLIPTDMMFQAPEFTVDTANPPVVEGRHYFDFEPDATFFKA